MRRRRPDAAGRPRVDPIATTLGVRAVDNPARGCIAGLLSWKLGGGLIGTIILFIIIYWILGRVG
jgi:hypothetical protein